MKKQPITNAEHHLIFPCLLKYRNKLISQGNTDGVDEFIIKYTK